MVQYQNIFRDCHKELVFQHLTETFPWFNMVPWTWNPPSSPKKANKQREEKQTNNTSLILCAPPSSTTKKTNKVQQKINKKGAKNKQTNKLHCSTPWYFVPLHHQVVVSAPVPAFSCPTRKAFLKEKKSSMSLELVALSSDSKRSVTGRILNFPLDVKIWQDDTLLLHNWFKLYLKMYSKGPPLVTRFPISPMLTPCFISF